VLHGREEPPVALAGHSWQHLLGGLEFFLCLPLLELVNVQAPILHVLDDGAPGQRHPDAVAQTCQGAVVGGKEDQPVAPVARFGTVGADVLQHGIEGQARLFARVEVLGC